MKGLKSKANLICTTQGEYQQKNNLNIFSTGRLHKSQGEAYLCSSVCQALLITPAGGRDGTGSLHQRCHYEPQAQDSNVTSVATAHMATRDYCLPSAPLLLCPTLPHLPCAPIVAQRGYITSVGLSSSAGLPFICCMSSSIFISLSLSSSFVQAQFTHNKMHNSSMYSALSFDKHKYYRYLHSLNHHVKI